MSELSPLFVSGPKPQPKSDAFHNLVHDLSKLLGPSSGIDSDDVNPEDLQNLMKNYTSKQSDWHWYAQGDSSRGYTRNLVDKGNGKSNLLVLVWTPGKGSPIHDHANAHCIMKILKGTLQETLYDWPDQSSIENGKPSPLKLTRERTYTKDQVTYMSDQLGLHRIMNPNPDEYAVSLHLYTPPNAATNGCHIFDEATGRKSHVKQNIFYSERGMKL